MSLMSKGMVIANTYIKTIKAISQLKHTLETI